MELQHLGVVSLNQTPLDWEGNCKRIISSIEEAKSIGVSLLCLPELCISGYGCEDTFLSSYTQSLAQEYLSRIARVSNGIVVTVGLPLLVEGQLYNASCVLADGKPWGAVLKQALPKEGIHYEPRWFRPWKKGESRQVSVSGYNIPVGDLIFDCNGISFGIEVCEDAWVADRPGIRMAKTGVDIICNPSASHFAFAKNKVREHLVRESSRSLGCAYLYANMLGNEAGRIIYDGNSLIAAQGEIVARGQRFSFKDYLLSSSTVDLRQLRAHRLSGAETNESDSNEVLPRRVNLEYQFKAATTAVVADSQPGWESDAYSKEQEFTRAVSLGLFDYLRKSRANGFVVSLSGGADSSATACLVATSVKLAVEELGHDEFCKKLSHILGLKEQSTVSQILGEILTCVYQATSNSSSSTQQAARALAEELGCEFHSVSVDNIVGAYVDLLEKGFEIKTSWKEHDTVLQNIQARARAPFVWMIANLKNSLLLATSNRSEAAVGYTTMDGDTCGGLSPIGGIDKAFLLSWLSWMQNGGFSSIGPVPALSKVLCLEPSAELRPASESQTDEKDLMPYVVLECIEDLAIRDRKSPTEVFQRLSVELPDYEAEQLLEWVTRFFRLWSINQWKRERYAPCFHLDDKNLDPKTWCRFPILSGGFERELADLSQK